MFECEHCGYMTKVHTNFLKHKNRKNPCYKSKKYIEQNLNVREQNLNAREQNLNVGEYRNKCMKCNKTFYNKSSLTRHTKICKGQACLTCPTCLKTFTTHQGKYQHMKNVSCIPPQQIIHNTTNNIVNNTQNNNININVFGKEDLSYLLQDNNLIHRINNYSKEGVYGLVKMLDDIYLNKERPENQTIIKPSDRGDGLYIRDNDGEWIYREYEDVKQDLVNSLDKYIEMYQNAKKDFNIQLTEPKERKRIKQLVTLLLTIGGMMNDELCRELNIDEEDIDGEDVVNKKFDNATKDRIHQKTGIYWKKIDGKIRRIEI